MLAFGIGLVFGFTFDTSAPAAYGPFGRRRRAAAIPAGGAALPLPPPVERSDDGVVDDREAVTTGAPSERHN